MTFAIHKVDVGIHPLRMTTTSLGILVMDSTQSTVYLIDDYGIKTALTSLNFPVWARILNGKIYIADVEDKSVSVWDTSGKLLGKVNIYRPQMLKIYKGKIYVSSGKTLYELSDDLRILKKWKFSSSSVYFYFDENKLIYLNYWQWDASPDVEIVDLNTGTIIERLELGLERPLRFIKWKDYYVFLGYKTGDVVFVKNGEILWKVNLPPFSYDMIALGDRIFISNLLKKGLYSLDPIKKTVEKIDLPYCISDMAVKDSKIIAAAIYDNLALLLKDGEITGKCSCSYPVMVNFWNGYAVALCSSEGSVCFMKAW